MISSIFAKPTLLSDEYNYESPHTEYRIPSSDYESRYKLITKNIYIHIPPTEEPVYQQTYKKPIARQHYNIVFIKGKTNLFLFLKIIFFVWFFSLKSCFSLFIDIAPTQPTPVAPEPIQDEHKTLVYVFVKNPSTESDTNAQETSTEPSKPEVFFVKYKENEETEKETNEK